MKKIENFEEIKKSYAYKLLQTYGKSINQPIEDLPQEMQLFLLFWRYSRMIYLLEYPL